MSSKDWYDNITRKINTTHDEKYFFEIILKNAKNTGIVDVYRYNIYSNLFDMFSEDVLVNSSHKSKHGIKNVSYHKNALRIGDYFSWKGDFFLCDEWENKELPYYDSMNCEIMNKDITYEMVTKVLTPEKGQYGEDVYIDIVEDVVRKSVFKNNRDDTNDEEIINLPDDISTVKVVYEERYAVDMRIRVSDKNYRIYGIDDAKIRIDENGDKYGILSILIKVEK